MDGKQHDERFVAGAVCPACHALDRIVVCVRADDGIERQRCVSCGFAKEGRPVESTPPASRLQRPAATPGKTVGKTVGRTVGRTPDQKVRIVDP